MLLCDVPLLLINSIIKREKTKGKKVSFSFLFILRDENAVETVDLLTGSINQLVIVNKSINNKET
ncbi:hypothetical protein [Dysgonomonas sp. HGC4]|uniref:hypothetical protein n=1 Tax=Dysgonomonas sp. HGC4 TaxID=1658009 RepID=UPI000B129B71|nr:hypothetical protein [Dysgonomonas sp. HGC4]